MNWSLAFRGEAGCKDVEESGWCSVLDRSKHVVWTLRDSRKEAESQEVAHVGRVENNPVCSPQCCVTFSESHWKDDVPVTTQRKYFSQPHQTVIKRKVKQMLIEGFSWFSHVIHEWLVRCLDFCFPIALSFLHSSHISTCQLMRHMKAFLEGKHDLY